MFCGKCGTKLSEGDAFCLSCGTKVSSTKAVSEMTDAGQGVMGQSTQPVTQYVGSQSSQSVGLSKHVIRFICANAVLFLTFFMGWLKVTGDAEEVFDFMGLGQKNSLSPSQLFSVFSKFKGSILGSEIPPQANVLYLLIVIPVAAGLAILFSLLKKNGLAKLCTVLSGIVTLLTAAAALLLTLTGEIGTRYGVFVAIISAIYAFIATGGLKLE